ncbi:MAG: Gfo/Idh/MocA family oxidoreductase [Actinomycetia bacterium]|nr:Gfo/Idh/MocA family oxidoreductase [Actinomycetes bacterium]
MSRVGIIGCGRISDLHLLGYEGRSDASVIALCDVNRDLATSRARAWGLPDALIYDDYRELCSSRMVDLVEIIIPHNLHHEVARYAIGCDLHVSLQKPMALSVEDADDLIDAAAESSRVVRLYENFIFYPPVLKAVELVESGVIGEPLAVRLKSNSGISPEAWAIPSSAQQWRMDPDACGGGPLTFDDGHHKFALAWLILGQPSEVHAWIGSTSTADGDLDAPSLVSMRYAGGQIASLEVVHSPDLLIQATRHYAQDDRMEITGTRGVIWVNRGHGQIGDPAPVASYADGAYREYDCEQGWEHSFIGATRHLLDAIAAGEEPLLTLAQGRDILATARAAQTSAAEESSSRVAGPVGAPPSEVRRRLKTLRTP